MPFVRPQGVRCRLAWGVALALLLLCMPGHADTSDMDTVKAGFVLNFIRFAKWPESAPRGEELRVCGLGARALDGKLADMRGRPARDQRIEVLEGAREAQWRDCQVLFIPASESDRVSAILRALNSTPVLTVSDAPGFAQAGGMIGLKQRGGRIRFDVNLAAIRRAGLDLSSQPLKLADEVLQ